MTNTQHYLTPQEVAKRIRVSENTLARWRMKKQPPEYYKFGGTILYTEESLQKFEKENLKRPHDTGT